MTALHFWLIGLGAVLAAGPVVLHLLMQEKPKRMLFPALRFVMQKQQVARRSIRLRHWLLLLLRVGVIFAIALALSRPAAATALFGSYLLLAGTVLSGIFFLFVTMFWRSKAGSSDGGSRFGSAMPKPQPTAGRWLPVALLALIVLGHLGAAIYLGFQIAQGDQGPVLTGRQPVSAAIVVDTSPRMNYRFNNQTRLQRAKQLAHSIVEQLPAGSQLAILDTGIDAPGLSLDLAAAGQQIDSLATSYQSVAMPVRARAALDLLNDSPLENQELYLIGDLTRPSWTAEGRRLKVERAAEDGITYLVDVGMKSYDNWSLSAWNTPTPSITPGGIFKVNCTVTRNAADQSDVDLVAAVAADHLESDEESEADSDASGADDGDVDDAATTVSANAADLEPETRTIRLLVEKPQAGRPVYRNGETITSDEYWERITHVTLAPGQSMEVAFQIPNLPKGEHQAWLEVVGGDAMPFDNQRYMTVRVEDAWQALVVAGPGVNDTNLVEAISPTELREIGQTSFDCKVIQAPGMETEVLGDYRVVFLLDPAPLEDQQWQQLQRYVANGGSVGIFLGHNALTQNGTGGRIDPLFQSEVAQVLLPGQLEDPWRSPQGELALDPIAWDHPIFSKMVDLRTQLLWGRLPVFMHLGLGLKQPEAERQSSEAAVDASAAGEDVSEEPSGTADANDPGKKESSENDAEILRSVRVLATFTNNMPALCETTYGQGQVITMTTPISDPTRPENRLPWNTFAVGSDWSFMYFYLINEISRYLATSQATSLNGMVGDSFFLVSDSVDSPQKYALFRPENQEPVELQVERGRLYVDFTELPGSYRLSGINAKQAPVLRGFSVNVAAQTSELTRIGKPQLDSMLGKGRYLVAENEQQIIRNQGQGRVGLEFYPSLIRLLAILFVCELLFSNFFYRTPANTAVGDL